MQDAARTADDVEGDEELTGDVAQEPLLADKVKDGEWHDEERYHEVGDGQRHDDTILNSVQVTCSQDGGDYEAVSGYGCQDDDTEQH